MRTQTEAKSRLIYLDNIRVFFVTWVIFHHSLRAYAPWCYYMVDEQKLVKLREDEHQKELIRVKEREDAQLQSIKTLWKAWTRLAAKARETKDELLIWEEKQTRKRIVESGEDIFQSSGRTNILRRSSGGFANLTKMIQRASSGSTVINRQIIYMNRPERDTLRRAEGGISALNRQISQITHNTFIRRSSGGPTRIDRQILNLTRNYSTITRRAAGGPAGIDTQLVAMSPNEMIINPRASRHFFSTLTAMNSNVQRFSGGGAPVNYSYNVGDININPQKASDIDVVQIGQRMRREIKRGRLKI